MLKFRYAIFALLLWAMPFVAYAQDANQVPSLATFRANAYGGTVWLAGYVTPGDGGQGYFLPNGKQSVTHCVDNGSTVIVDKNGTCWERQSWGGVPVSTPSMVTVPTIAALENIGASAGASVTAAYVPGIGIYQWNATSTATPDPSDTPQTIVQVTGVTTGRMVLQNGAVGNVANIAALEALPDAPIGMTVNVGGYTTPGDGGGGSFTVVSGTLSASDGGTTFFVANSAGGTYTDRYWKRKFTGDVNVGMYGASPSLTDSTTQIQEAIQGAIALGVPLDFKPCGTYTVSAQIRLPISANFCNGKSILQGTSAIGYGAPVLSNCTLVSCGSNIVWNYPSVIGTGANGPQGIWIEESSNVLVYDPTVSNVFAKAIDIYASNYVTVLYGYLHGITCTSNSPAGDGVSIEYGSNHIRIAYGDIYDFERSGVQSSDANATVDGTDVTIDHETIGYGHDSANCSPTQQQAGIYFEQTANAKATDNYIYDIASGINQTPGQVYGIVAHGLMISSEPDTAIISGNTIIMGPNAASPGGIGILAIGTQTGSSATSALANLILKNNTVAWSGPVANISEGFQNILIDGLYGDDDVLNSTYGTQNGYLAFLLNQGGSWPSGLPYLKSLTIKDFQLDNSPASSSTTQSDIYYDTGDYRINQLNYIGVGNETRPIGISESFDGGTQSIASVRGSYLEAGQASATGRGMFGAINVYIHSTHILGTGVLNYSGQNLSWNIGAGTFASLTALFDNLTINNPYDIRGSVDDATACTFATAITGGGSTKCPVYDDGGLKGG